MAAEQDDFIKDLEEDDTTLDFDEGESVEFWASKQKELVTSVVDYNLSTLVDLIGSDVLELNPKYQRRLRWDPLKKSKLIESFLMNVPVPPIFLNEDDYGKYSVIDGKQRLNAIHQFLTNNLRLEGLKLFSDINGNTFNDLPTTLRNIIRTRPTVRAIIILRQSDSDIKYEVFQRLNTGGAKLNAQEIRNNAFHGKLNSLVMDMSEAKFVQDAFGIRNKSRSAMYQQMRDAELVLRFLAFKDSWDTFKGGMKRVMDTFMEKNRNPSQAQLDEYKHDFFTTMNIVQSVFGENAFHRWVPEKGNWRRQVLASLYDAQMFGLSGYTIQQVTPHKEVILDSFKALFGDDDFRKSIDAATNTPKLFKDRVSRMRNLISDFVNL